MEPPETIICVDCGGVCHLTTAIDADDGTDEGEGTVIGVYRCEDCLDRWDVVFDAEDPI